jgi:aminoglycoside phosphotransferase (APT) family kinase protein
MPESLGAAGRRLVGQGREAEILEWNDGTVLRLLRSSRDTARVRQEEAALRAAWDAGVEVPAVYGTTTVDGRPGLIMDRVDGPDLITLMSRRPWSVPRAARIVGTTQARMHDVVAPPELPSLHANVRFKIGAAPDLPPDLAAFALAELDGLGDGDRLCHGDLHPGNVLMGRDGPAVIDWTDATRGDPAADLARTRLLLNAGAVPEHMPALIRRLQAFGRGTFFRRYVRAYEELRPIDTALVDRWETVRAADRVFEGIPEERSTLLEILERARANPGRR